MDRIQFWGRSLLTGATWFYRALNPVLFVVALLAAVGVVVVVSLTGPPWFIILVVALVVLFGFAEGAYREWQKTDAKVARQQSAEQKQEDLSWKCVILSEQIRQFIAERQAESPMVEHAQQILSSEQELPPSMEIEHLLSMRFYENETQFQYTKQFGQQVFEVVTGLRELGLVSESETEGLNYPRDLDGVMRVATRISDLGHRIGGTPR